MSQNYGSAAADAENALATPRRDDDSRKYWRRLVCVLLLGAAVAATSSLNRAKTTPVLEANAPLASCPPQYSADGHSETCAIKCSGWNSCTFNPYGCAAELAAGKECPIYACCCCSYIH